MAKPDNRVDADKLALVAKANAGDMEAMRILSFGHAPHCQGRAIRFEAGAQCRGNGPK